MIGSHVVNIQKFNRAPKGFWKGLKESEQRYLSIENLIYSTNDKNIEEESDPKTNKS